MLNKIQSLIPRLNKELMIIIGMSLIAIIIHLPIMEQYNYHSDELYFVDCGNNLSFGYADHAPLVSWIAGFNTFFLGGTLWGLRFFSVLGMAIVVFVVGLIVRQLKGGTFAILIGCLSIIIAPVYLRVANQLNLVTFETLCWTLAYFFIVKIIQEDKLKYWLLVGVCVGIGMLAKHSMFFFAFGIIISLAVTPMRKHFKSKFFYFGILIALCIFLPNLIWQIINNWPTPRLIMKENLHTMQGITSLQFIIGQFYYLHPINAFLWIPGLIYFFKHKEEKNYRLFSILWLSIFILFIIVKSKIYYLSPTYPILLAGGAVVLENWVKKRLKIWLKPLLLCVMILLGVIIAPLSLPIFDIDTTEKYLTAVTGNYFENISELIKNFRRMLGWEERVKKVAEIYNSLTEEEKQYTAILAKDYGNPAAINFYGKKYGLPLAYSMDQSYWLWRRPPSSAKIYITVDFELEKIEPAFNNIELAASLNFETDFKNQNPFTLYICRDAIISIDQIWKKYRPW